MSRRAASITQADVSRACRAARAMGPEWFVEIHVKGSDQFGQIKDAEADAFIAQRMPNRI
jgi:hypothetical protein